MNLHGQIMSLQPRIKKETATAGTGQFAWHHYEVGFDDARSLSAELALQADAEIERLTKLADAKQARIDALMFEFCPGEMTPEQVAEWGRHQRATRDPEGRKHQSFGGVL